MVSRNLPYRLVNALCMIWCMVAIAGYSQQPNNLALTGSASASSHSPGFEPANAIDGKSSSWKSAEKDSLAWLMVKLPGATEIHQIQIKADQQAIKAFRIQTMLNGTWRNVREIGGNQQKEIDIRLETPLLSDRIRFSTEEKGVSIVELQIFGQAYVDTLATTPKAILLNQSGFNLGRPKRFTAARMRDPTAFVVKTVEEGQVVYEGLIKGGLGDFSDFNPQSSQQFIIVADGETSYPFRIGPNWLERVTYRNLIDFMAGARQYVGTTHLIRPLSWEWRDGDFFNWALQSMIALYLSNPVAFERMEQTLQYVSNASFPKAYTGLWGALLPFRPNSPDIIQLIHWDVDIKISQQLDHEMQKAELAHFLYAWPYLNKWLPQQNFDTVYQYLKEKWEKPTVSPHSTSQYDLSPEHNLLELKTRLGTTKGELPPGHSVIPNLMMYEVARRQGEADAEKYFEAAYRQMEWMIDHLDWNDPMTTKGQRMSEHITMRAFAYFFHEYPDQAPPRVKEKVEEWTMIALSRSNNFWDFRKYSEEEWTPPSWNETGNILGFPAAALAAMTVLEGSNVVDRLELLVWSHIDNAFGRNPVGRHFSHNGPEEIEGVDMGWYNRHQGGIGLLEEVRFVFDGSPKSFHYPNQPEVGNLGWTEGWVQFNTAFNTSMAYLANYYTSISLNMGAKDKLTILLTAAINFYPEKEETATVQLSNSRGVSIDVALKETGAYSDSLRKKITWDGNNVKVDGQLLSVEKGETICVSYGYGFFQKRDCLQLP